jgi:hypothetical protein
MSHVNDARNRPLSSLVSTLKFDSEANSAKDRARRVTTCM